MAADMVRWPIRWGNPSTIPTDGHPRIKAAKLVHRGEPCPPEIAAQKTPGDGWALCWELVSQKPIRRWSTEAKARVRKQNLRRRIEKKFPLFSEDFIAAELAAKPEYYEARECPLSPS